MRTLFIVLAIAAALVPDINYRMHIETILLSLMAGVALGKWIKT